MASNAAKDAGFSGLSWKNSAKAVLPVGEPPTVVII